jgi:hypothetical protein
MSFTGIGRIGSQHTLTSPQDDAKYLFNSMMWCTHPLLGGAIFGDGFDITAGSNIVKSGGAGTDFTLLCQDIQANNSPLNKYIAYYNGTYYGVLEVDYVLNADTLILKYPAFETATVGAKMASLIDYWGTPILKEVEVLPNLGGSTATFFTANKYSSNTYTLYDYPWSSQNEGGLEPMLISSTTDAITILKY